MAKELVEEQQMQDQEQQSTVDREQFRKCLNVDADERNYDDEYAQCILAWFKAFKGDMVVDYEEYAELHTLLNNNTFSDLLETFKGQNVFHIASYRGNMHVLGFMTVDNGPFNVNTLALSDDCPFFERWKEKVGYGPVEALYCSMMLMYRIMADVGILNSYALTPPNNLSELYGQIENMRVGLIASLSGVKSYANVSEGMVDYIASHPAECVSKFLEHFNGIFNMVTQTRAQLDLLNKVVSLQGDLTCLLDTIKQVDACALRLKNLKETIRDVRDSEVIYSQKVPQTFLMPTATGIH